MGQTAIRRFRYAPCGSDLFTDPTTGFVYPQVESVEPTWGIKAYTREFQVADLEHFQSALGERESGIKFTMEARGFGGSPAGAGNNVAASDGEVGLLLKSCFGSQKTPIDKGSTVASATTSSVTVAAGTGANFTAGGFVGVNLAGAYHARQIRSKATDVLTLDRALPSAPAASDVVYGSNFFNKATYGQQHLWFDVEAYDGSSGYRRYIRGALGNVAFKNLAANGRMMLEFDFKGVDWEEAAPAQISPVYPSNLPTTGAFVRSTRLWVDATEQKVSSFELELGNDIQPKTTTSAKNGVASYFVKDTKSSVKFTASYEDNGATLIAKWKNRTTFDLLVEITQGGAGNSFAVAAPVVEIVAVKPVSLNGLDALECECRIIRNDANSIPSLTFGIL